MNTLDVVSIAVLVARALEAAGSEYFLGGSLASSHQGEPRATNDIDFVLSMSEPQVAPFERALGEDFLVDAESLLEAVREVASWNIIHLPSVTKIDLIMCGSSAFDVSEFSRRERVELRPGESLAIKSPEDSIIRKLLWFREGGGVSDRQMRDVAGVLRHSARTLDNDYLDRWAMSLGIDDLLEVARRSV